MQTLLVILNVTLWIALIILAFFLYALVAFIGRILRKVQMTDEEIRLIQLGDPAPSMELQDIEGREISISQKSAGRKMIILCLSQECVVCKTLIPHLSRVKSLLDEWDVVLFVPKYEVSSVEFAHELQSFGFPVVLSTDAIYKFGVTTFPYLLAIDENRILIARGVINRIESIFLVLNKQLSEPS